MDENVIFDVKSEIFTIGAKLHLCDTSGNYILEDCVEKLGERV